MRNYGSTQAMRQHACSRRSLMVASRICPSIIDTALAGKAGWYTSNSGGVAYKRPR